MCPEGPATGYFDASFLGFSLSLSKCLDGSQFASSYHAALQTSSNENYAQFLLEPIK
jgi:hypothetical protein